MSFYQRLGLTFFVVFAIVISSSDGGVSDNILEITLLVIGAALFLMPDKKSKPEEEVPPEPPPAVAPEAPKEGRRYMTLLSRKFFSTVDSGKYKGPFDSAEGALGAFDPEDMSPVQIIEVLAPSGAYIEVDSWRVSPRYDTDKNEYVWEGYEFEQEEDV